MELRRLDDGRVALLAFTALDRLVWGCGAKQPWTLVETARLDEIDRARPFDVVVLDAQVPHQYRHGGGAAG